MNSKIWVEALGGKNIPIKPYNRDTTHTLDVAIAAIELYANAGDYWTAGNVIRNTLEDFAVSKEKLARMVKVPKIRWEKSLDHAFPTLEIGTLKLEPGRRVAWENEDGVYETGVVHKIGATTGTIYVVSDWRGMLDIHPPYSLIQKDSFIEIKFH